jgi:hypothetical protein
MNRRKKTPLNNGAAQQFDGREGDWPILDRKPVFAGFFVWFERFSRRTVFVSFALDLSDLEFKLVKP